MTQFLIARFVRDNQNTTDPKVRERYGLLSSVVGVCCNVVLFLIKFALGTLSGSIAITADAFNNLSDVGSCLVTMLGFKMAAKPADADHPYGHGRIEYLSGLAISVFILAVGLEFIGNAVEKILHPSPVAFSAAVLAGLLASILVKLWMYRFNTVLGRAIQSASLAATAADSISDVMATTVTLLSVIAGRFTTLPVDGVMGLVVSGMILKAGYGVAKDTITPLLGTRPDPELVREIKRLILQYDGIVGVHDLLVHDYGPGRIFASVHAEVPLENDVLYSHDIIDNAEREIAKRLNIHIVIHMDPIQTGSPELDALRMQVVKKMQEIDPRFSIHDFRMVSGHTHSNLIFDVLIPIDYPDKEETVAAQAQEKLRELDPTFEGVITVDRDFT
ncbi:MAG: cation transporter [Clostridiales bacterium]|nr:cation transporter [Clostridiales bacterium]